MAWTLSDLDFDPVKLGLSLAKAIGGAACVVFLKRMWRVIVGDTKQCMIMKCIRVASKRGLCLICYSKAKKKVEDKETTWEKLVEMGLCESDKDPFDDAYTRAMDDIHVSYGDK